MKRRATLVAILFAALAVPVAATGEWFSDVPDDHPNRRAIAWSKEQGLFLGYRDGSFRPSAELSENQLHKLVERLFGKQDSWTRSDTAQFLYDGWHGPAATTTTTTTRPVATQPTTTAMASSPSNTYWHWLRRDAFDSSFSSWHDVGFNRPKTPDPLLKVAVYHGDDEDFHIRWTRPGWEKIGWKWQYFLLPGEVIRWTEEERERIIVCSLAGAGYNQWQVGRINRGHANHWYEEDGLCEVRVRQSEPEWGVTIMWNNGARFISEPCVRVADATSRSGRGWDCSAPTGWLDWPDYNEIVPVLTYKGSEIVSRTTVEVTYRIVLGSSRDVRLAVLVCDDGTRLKRRDYVDLHDERDNEITVSCPSVPSSGRFQVEFRPRSDDVMLLDEPLPTL